MRKIKIISDGTPQGTRAWDPQTQEAIPCASELTVSITPEGIDARLFVTAPYLELSMVCDSLVVEGVLKKCRES